MRFPMKTYFLYLAILLVVGLAGIVALGYSSSADTCRWILFPGLAVDLYLDRKIVNLGRAGDTAMVLLAAWLIWAVVAHFILLVLRSLLSPKSGKRGKQ
jgi:hypothetical protein